MSDVFADFVPHPEIACNDAVYDPAVHKVVYRVDYEKVFGEIAAGRIPQRLAFRELIKNDLFFIVHFIMSIPKANHPFVVARCKELEDGPQTNTLDIWAREHFKSTSANIAMTVKRIVNDPECTTCIFSFKKPAAEKFLDAIRKVLENPLMVACFPEILYEKPYTEAPSWSLQGGIRVKRKSTARKEHTVEASGLMEGMGTGAHYDHRIYDDVETADVAANPEQLEVLMDRFEMSRNLGSEGGTEQIIGTYYSHNGLLVKLGEKVDIHGKPMYILRKYAATDDGTITGKPVFFSQQYLDSKKMDSTFNTQQLCNPTPLHDIKLDWKHVKVIKRSALPPNRVKFVIIDPAGDKDVLLGAKSDKWAMLTVSIVPDKDDWGLSDVYVEDGIVDTLNLTAAISAVCNLYRRSGRVSLLAIEQVGQSSHYEHVKKALEQDYGVWLALKKKGKVGGNLQLLSPSGRNKNYRIESALSWPLMNGKIHVVDDLPFLDGIKDEMAKFPFFHVDILDSMAYLYDLLADTTTPMLWFETYREQDLEPDW